MAKVLATFVLLLAVHGAPAFGSNLPACLFYLSDLVPARAQERAVQDVKRFFHGFRLWEEYTRNEAPPPFEVWSKRNQDRGARAFRVPKATEKETYLAELALQKEMRAKRAALEANPKSADANREMADAVQRYLSHTGVFAEVKPAYGTAFDVVVTPMTLAAWRVKMTETFGTLPPEVLDRRPDLVYLAERLGREKIGLQFDSDDLAKSWSTGHYQTGNHISVGTPDLFMVGLGSTYFHELGHHEHDRRVGAEWDVVAMSLPVAPTPKFPSVVLRGKGGEPISRMTTNFKDTSYANSHFMEEGPNTYRQAVYFLSRARKFKRIAETTGLAEARSLALYFAGRARERSWWAQDFLHTANELLHTLDPEIHSYRFEDPFTLKGFAISEKLDYSIKFEDGRSIEFSSAQIPGFVARASDRKTMEANLEAAKQTLGFDLRRAVLDLERRNLALRKSIGEEFGIEPRDPQPLAPEFPLRSRP